MHRSGTSLVSRVVNLLGVELGSEQHLVPPASDNPTGFWEHASIKSINDQVLARCGGTWQDPPPLPTGWERASQLDEVRKAAADVVRSQLGESELAGWKDPRTSLTLPFWRTVIPVSTTILCVRPPGQVAASLQRRNGFEPEKSAALWVRYTLSAWLADPDGLVVRYDEFFSDLEAVVRRLCQHLSVPEASADRLAAIRSFVDPGLEHDKDSLTPSDGPKMRVARIMYDLLLRDEPTLSRPLFGAIADTWIAEADALRARRDHDAVIEERERLQGSLAVSGEQIERLTSRVRRETERAEFARARLDRYTSERDDALRAKGDAERAAARDRGQLEILQQQVAEAQRSASKSLEAVTQQLRTAQRELEGARRELGEVRRSYERLRGRRMVRVALLVAQPFRPLFRAVRRLRSRSRPAAPEASRGGEERGASGEKAPTELWHAPRMRLDLETAECLHGVGPVTVVVPIHNAHEELRRCVDALVRNTTWPARLLLIDDASTEPEIAGLLEDFSALEAVRVLRNERNLGFVGTVNRGFQSCGTDVVVLNSDTAVTPRWLENLVFAAYRAEDIGTVTPLSNNAGAFSVPEIGQDNDYPPHLDFDDVGRLVTQTSRRRYPQGPTGNGFCMYVKRRMLGEVGIFDAEAFPRGYGEENDLCMRALKAGWRHVVDDAAYVFHQRSASFKSEREALVRAGRKMLDERHPEYTALVRAFVRSPALTAVQDEVRRAFEQAGEERARTRVLYVIHDGQGGTPQTNLDLMRRLEERYDCLLLTSDTRTLRLQQLVGGELQVVDEAVLDKPIVFAQTTREDYRQVVTAILVRFGIELVHVRHLFKHTLDLPEIAGALGIPVILSLHDFYFSCPTIHLLDDHDRFCGGVCTPGAGNCRVPTRWVRASAPPLKHEWVHVWRERVGAVLPHCDALVTTSPTARDIYLRSYPELQNFPFEVIEHGRDMVAVPSLAEPPVPGETIRILVPGNLDVHKGGWFVAELKAIDQRCANRLEFHFIGDAPPDFRELGVWHGPYERDAFNDLVKAIGPAFVGLFSIWAETYSHTLTEALAAGVPVFASDLGALGERLREGGGGWPVDVTDAEASYEAILAVADEPAEYERVRASATLDSVRSVADMATDYDALYRRVRLARRSLAGHDGPPGQFGRQVPRIGLAVVGDRSRHPGSVHVRTLRRFGHPAVAGRVQAGILDIDAFLRKENDIDLLYVQRTAIPPALTDELLERCRRDGVPLVVDLDDNLVDPDLLADRPGDWQRFVPSLHALSREAVMVTVSTPRLAEAVAAYAERVEVVPNQLDEALWFRQVDMHGSLEGDAAGDTTRPFRLLYMGTSTHGEDLAMLRQVLPPLRNRLDRDVTLDVIGGEPEGGGQDWYTRVRVPPGRSEYPAFVHWLRGVRGRWDVAVAPLAPTPFNAYKSDLKFLEYAALGLPGVYSRLEPYADSVEDGVTGMLADPDPACWVEALVSLAKPDLGRETAERARAKVLRERTMRLHASRYVDLLFDAVGRTR
jgi:GT2 family glycosyltransferase/glycosyltransferase involved in cell wall biosynthesis